MSKSEIFDRRQIVRLMLALLVVATTILITSQPAEARRLRETLAGDFIDTSVDVNNDGVAGSNWDGVAKGSGSPTYGGVIEVDFEATGRCDPGVTEGVLAAYSIVRQYGNGDMLASRLVEGFVCFDTSIGLGTVDVEAEFVGGTGRYADATGSYTAQIEIRLLIADRTGGIAHGMFTGTTSGTID